MSNLKEQFAAKILQIAPLIERETYNDLSTQEIIESINQVKNDTQNALGVNKLEDLLPTLSREDAIQMSIELWSHIGKRLVKEYKAM